MAQQHERNLAGLGRDRVSLVPQSTGLPPDTHDLSGVGELSFPATDEPPVPVMPRGRRRRPHGVLAQPPASVEPEISASEMSRGSPVPVPILGESPGVIEHIPEEVSPEESVQQDESVLPEVVPEEFVPEPSAEESSYPVQHEDPEPVVKEPAIQEETQIQPDIPEEGEPMFASGEEQTPQVESESLVPQEPSVSEQDGDRLDPIQNTGEVEEISAVEEAAAEEPVEEIPLTLDPLPAAAQLPDYDPLPPPTEEPDPLVPHTQEPMPAPDPLPQPPVIDPLHQQPETPVPVTPESAQVEEEQLPAQEEVVLPPDLAEEEEQREEDRRWSMQVCFRLISPHQNALRASEGFVGEDIRPESDGLYALHKDVKSSLQAHLRVVQKKEWDTIKVPSRTGLSKAEKMQAEKWERTKQHFADILSRRIVADPMQGSKLAPGEISETFAFKLYYWMQECIRSLMSVYQERDGETARINSVLALVGITDLPSTTVSEMKKKRYQDILMRGLWNVYQNLHMRGKNSSVEFVRQVAGSIKAKHGEVMDEDELYYAMDIFRKLPFFGKEGELMNAIELATVAISQPEGAYATHTNITSLAPNSREWKTISFIQRKIPLTSERRVYPPTSRRRSRTVDREEEEDDESSP